MNEYTAALEGKTVVEVDVSQEERALRFRCSDGSAVVWDTKGDCCSQSWWADGSSLNALCGAEVRSAVPLYAEMRSAVPLDMSDYNVEDGRTRQEFDLAYGVRIETAKGVATFVFRNSSNGYYGGWAFLGSDSKQFEWREITGNDWQA